MKRFYVWALVLVICFYFSSCSQTDGSNNTPEKTIIMAYNQASCNNYDVLYRQDKLELDGNLDDSVWQTVGDISGSFHYPWEEIEAPFTSFKAFHDKENLYFSFEVIDKDVVKIEEWNEDESTVDNEDRVELFFASTSVDKPDNYKLPIYYATEVDPLGRAHDYSVEYYRKFDSKFNFENAKYAAVVNDSGYTVEGMIPIKTFKELKLINPDNTMRAGVFRAEFSKKSDSDDLIMQWISWVNPKTIVPDFHVDSAFGEFRFIDMD